MRAQAAIAVASGRDITPTVDEISPALMHARRLRRTSFRGITGACSHCTGDHHASWFEDRDRHDHRQQLDETIAHRHFEQRDSARLHPLEHDRCSPATLVVGVGTLVDNGTFCDELIEHLSNRRV